MFFVLYSVLEFLYNDTAPLWFCLSKGNFSEVLSHSDASLQPRSIMSCIFWDNDHSSGHHSRYFTYAGGLHDEDEYLPCCRRPVDPWIFLLYQFLKHSMVWSLDLAMIMNHWFFLEHPTMEGMRALLTLIPLKYSFMVYSHYIFIATWTAEEST